MSQKKFVRETEILSKYLVRNGWDLGEPRTHCKSCRTSWNREFKYCPMCAKELPKDGLTSGEMDIRNGLVKAFRKR